jgi:hypothetical protein
MNRKLVSVATLIVIFIGIFGLSFNMNITSVKSSSNFPTDMPVVYVDPQNVSMSPGETFSISVKIFNLTDTIYACTDIWEPGQPLPPPGSQHVYTLGNLYGLDIQFSWDPTVLEYVSHSVKIPVETYTDGVLHEPLIDIIDNVDATTGTYWLAKSSHDPAQAFNSPDANATVFTMTFNVTRNGTCVLNLTAVDLAADPDLYFDGTINMLQIPCWTKNAIFRTPILATRIENLKIEAQVNDLFFDPPVILGENAAVTITMKNDGEITDAYNLTLYKDTGPLETWNNETLESSGSKTFNHKIDATSLDVGNHTITANASVIHGIDTFTDELSKGFRVIDAPELRIVGPNFALFGDTATFDASQSFHNDPWGSILNYTWSVYMASETVPRYVYSGVNITHRFVPENRTWRVVLDVKDNYGLEYNKDRPATAPYRKEVIFTCRQFNSSLGYLVGVVSNSSIEEFHYFGSNSTIEMRVLNMTADQIYGFCRLTIPHALLSPPYNITINGKLVAYTTLIKNETLRIIYFSYEHSSIEITIVPEFASFLILPLLMIVTLLAVIFYRRKKFK